MTHASKDSADLSRRTALTGLAGGAGVLLASGCTPLGATSAQGPTPSRTGSATGSADGAAPGVMTLFKDPGFNFNGLLALGAAGQGSSEVGEVLTAVSLDITDVVGRIQMPTLVLDYDYEQFYPGQPRQMFDKLTSPKDHLKLTAATGAQLHCSPMAPQQHCEVVFDWLQETLPGR
ncbi:hypothetical protein ACFYPZ_16700 [Streptomyces sp. NPDC005506]|uniref:hypothetical protein n=1 Tax=unclassified Streptomyces TaxID=2593676 RepID=UPI0036C6436F